MPNKTDIIHQIVDFEQLQADLAQTNLSSVSSALCQAVEQRMQEYTHGEIEEWHQLLQQLPPLTPEIINLETGVIIGSQAELECSLNPAEQAEFIDQLKILHPWRKGPFDLFGIHIDTEWRSDWKWDRLLPHITPLQGRTILDVGCGNGYHCWRMQGAGAKVVIGIDPSQKFLAQFSVIKHFLPDYPVHLLPIGIEHMPPPEASSGFDTVFSMGVLYHRRSPIDHLIELKTLLRPGGELVLETLVIDGDENQVLVPGDRYAQMRNVWFIPSAKALELWLKKSGFKQVRTLDINQTSLEEQRATEWMTFHSLSNYLDPENPDKTIEGYPAPKRAIIIANKPG